MTALLLDTTVLVDTERGRGQLEDLIGDNDSVAIAAITAAELLVGVHRATRRHRDRRKAFVDAVLDVIPILPYDAEVAVVHAELLAEIQRAGRARGAHNLIIAATGRATNRTVVTADPKGFDGLTGVSVSTYR